MAASPSSSPFKIRPASTTASDPELLVDFQDSQIPWLSTVGASEQWGTKSAREKDPKVLERTRAKVAKSEQNGPWNSEWCRAFVAESSRGTPVAGLVLAAHSASYVHERGVLPEQDERDPFVYVDYLISNRHAGEEAKGAGAALIEVAKEEARKVGVYRLCLDCFRGNDRKLVKYYEKQGFHAIGDFEGPPERNYWPGAVMEMRI